jgi:hypothetical protein
MSTLEFPQHSLLKSLLLHVLPGALTAAAFLVLKPLLDGSGTPPLLPRLSRYGKWAPLLGGLFFGLYHVWQAFGFPTVFLLGVALGYVVWWKRDVRIPIGLHMFANALVRAMMLLAALAM